MKKYYLSKLKKKEYSDLLKRPAIDITNSIEVVQPILTDVKSKGSKAALEYARKYDGYNDDIKVTQKEFEDAENKIDSNVKKAMLRAYKNIENFHLHQKPQSYSMETEPGVKCSREFRPIENVGLYIPGGSAPLPSTLLMLGIPAKIAGCKRIIAASPVGNNLPPEILFAANLCGIKEFYKIGGAQAIALMAYGSKSVKKADKIFGPGNQYVTAAKMLVSIDPEGCAIDMPAGPSEVLVIADENSDPEFVASDLLSQAEHGNDSQSLLVSDSQKLVELVEEEIVLQTERLTRKKIIEQSLKNSFALITENLSEAINFSNDYAPEHLILNIKDAGKYIPLIQNAGSVFLGEFSPESAGDYASGTNHSLPTYGYAKSYSGVSVESFMKSISFQKLSKEGLSALSETIINLAEAESLDAHSSAVKVRMK